MSREKRVKKKGKAAPKGRPEKRALPYLARFSHLWEDKSLLSGEALVFVFLVSLTLLFIVGPFQRGLFFTWELLNAKILVFGLLFLWGAFRLASRDGRFLEGPLDLTLLALIAAYLLSLTVAVNQRAALEEFLKITAYFSVYLISLELCRYLFGFRRMRGEEDAAEKKAIPPGLAALLNILLFSVMVSLVATFGDAAGTWDVQYAYDGNRINSPMGYANTAAAYFMAAYLLALGLVPLAKKALRPIYAASAALLLLGVVLTFSRGAWLLLPPLGLLLLLVAPRGERLRSLLYMAVTVVAALPLAMLTDRLFRLGPDHFAWGPIVLSFAIAAALSYGVELFLAQPRKFKIALAGTAGAIAAAVIIIVAGYPALGPAKLDWPEEGGTGPLVLEQVIERVRTDEAYTISLQIQAAYEGETGAEELSGAWGIRVLSSDQNYQRTALLSHSAGITDGFELLSFQFSTTPDTRRLTVQVYNNQPGLSLTTRAVTLSGGGSEKGLSFYWNRILPERLYDRIFSESRDRNLGRRIELFGDAIKVIKDYGILGAGGGGWAALYYSYQDQLYHSNEVHNHYLQVWVEAGLLGFLSFTGIWIILAIIVFYNSRSPHYDPLRQKYWAAIFLPVAALGLHSVIDWNFSMAAVGFYLFALLGAARSLDQVTWFKRGSMEDRREKRSFAVGLAGLAIGMFLLIYTIVLSLGFHATWRAHNHLERVNIRQALVELERAISLDPLMAENFYKLSVLNEEQGQRTGNQAAIAEAIEQAERAYSLEPYNPTYVARYGGMLYQYVNAEEALPYIDRLIELRPFQARSYQEYCSARFRLAEFYLETGLYGEAETLLREIVALEEEAVSRLGGRQELSYELGRAHFFLRDFNAAEERLMEVPDEHPMREEVQLMLQLMES